jgi:hypothetical protein
MPLAFDSVDDLAQAMLRAGLAHGEYEERLGQGRDENWPIWYAEHMEQEQSAASTTSGYLTFASASDLAEALLRAEQAHAEHQAETGREEPDWPHWYARYIEREQVRE